MRNPIIMFLDDGRMVRLCEDIRYISNTGKEWIASEGIIIDGASIPRFLWWLIGSPFAGKYRRAAIFHDAYYKDHDGNSKESVDRVFLEIMKTDKVNFFKRRAMYIAVKLFGKNAWIKRE